MFQGDHVNTPIASILDDEYNSVTIINGRNVTSGMTTGENFSQYQDEILYWEILCDTIFSVSDYNKISPKYFVDFGKYSIPQSERINKDVYDLIEYTNKEENIKKTASFIWYVNEDDKYLRFMFVFNRQIYYVFYNKANKTAQTYCFENSSKFKASPFVYYNNGRVYLSVSSEDEIENNPYIVVFEETLFTK